MSLRYYEVRAEEVAERLRKRLGADPRVKLAAMFGSVLRRSVVRDVDMAVYAAPRMSLAEILRMSGKLEEALEYPWIWSLLTGPLRTLG